MKKSVIILLVIFTLATIYYVNKPNPYSPTKPSWLHSSRVSLFKVLPKRKNTIVFLGASIIQHCEWHELLGQSVFNRGIAGDTTHDVLSRLDSVYAQQPSKLFIMVGLNDLFRKHSVSEVLKNYERIITIIQTQTPDTKIYFSSLLPVTNDTSLLSDLNPKISQVNKMLSNLCTKKAIQYLDLYSSFADQNGSMKKHLTYDGIHLTGQGYMIIREKIYELLLSDE